jgi:hypothetical protein
VTTARVKADRRKSLAVCSIFWVIAALVNPVACKALTTCTTFELKKAGEELPKDVLPRYFATS